MPDVTNYATEKEWMSACVPKAIEEGNEQEQAVAMCMTMWQKKSLDLDALKIGARNSRNDAQRLQMIHDYAKENGAACDSEDKSIDLVGCPEDDTMITFGDSVKAARLDNGDVKLTGYLVRFGSADDSDLTGDFFTAKTDFGKRETSDGWFNHRMPVKYRGKQFTYADQLPDVKLTRDDVGVFAEIIIGARNEYEKMIADAGLAGALGWSSGTAPHLVDRKPAGKAQEIIKWPLGFDASLTPTPAEPRNGAIALKTYQPTMLDIDATPQAAQENRDEAQTSTADADQSIKSHEVDIMSDEQFAELKTLISAQGEKINALETVIKTAPVVSEVKAASVVVTSDPADRPFTNVAEQMQAVKSFAMSNGQNKDARLSRIEAKALGGNEAIPSEGGFLLDPILVADILKPMHEPNTLPAMARQLPVGNNSNFGWINGVDETSRADGSRWGGVLGYRLAEAATKTASQPKFRRINWELKKYAVLIYGTDELLADAAQFSAIVNVAAGEELLFMVGADIMGGLGVAGPLGILASPALVSVAKEAGQSAATITSVNLSKMWARLPSRSKASAAWFVNTDTNVQLDQLSIPVAMGALEPRFVNYNASGAMTIKGRPVIETEFNPTLGTVGDVLLADMNEYLFWQKAGVDAATSIHVQFLTDQTVFRFVMRCDGTPSVSTPLTPYKGSATLSPFVALATRA